MTASGSAGRFEYQNGQPVPIRGAALNAEEEPEHEDYPKDPNFQKEWGPRGVIKSSADGRVEDTGPLTKKRMETVDEEFASAAVDFIKRANSAKKPFSVWLNTSRMHYYTDNCGGFVRTAP